ncbi:MAG: zinc dependent phospholipase C family protein [Gemmatimonadota bacterium]
MTLRTLGRIAATLVVALLWIALTPTDLLAWTPGTHIHLGEAVLRSLTLLPAGTAALLRTFPQDFLYGSIAADTSMAKKYAPTGRHCHSWAVGFEIYERARDEALRAFALGYLSHLAADVVAHNFFVPRQLTVTSSTSALGHSYWESRFETHLGEAAPRRARDVILLDHSRADAHLDDILSPTIFSTSTNRRLFRGMVHVTDSESWQRIYRIMADNSRWGLTRPEVELNLVRSFEYVMDLLERLDRSEPYQFDPSGDEALRLAKRLRRVSMRRGGDPFVREEAERHFGLPETALRHAETLEIPLYPAARDDSN